MSRPQVVIVGGGFAGIAAARRLRGAPVDVTLVDRNNHHLFQPLLYQVATGGLAPTEIAAPIRTLLKRQANATVLMADVAAVDAPGKALVLADGGRIGFDYLILAGGARHAYFGRDDWEAFAPGLKSLADALEMRRRFLSAFEEAERAEDPDARAAWLTFVVVGGGPTGCELAGVLPEIARLGMRREFRRIDPTRARIVLIENSPRVLNVFPEDLAARAQRDLQRLGVEIVNERKAAEIDAEGVTLDDGTRIAARTVFWAAGNRASPLGGTLGVPTDRAGRVVVDPDLSVPGHPDIFVVGDMASVRMGEHPVPGVAPAATQMGRHASETILERLRGAAGVPFVYRDKGSLAVLGRNAAVAQVGRVHLAGFLAWLMWLFIHVLYLVGYRNRFLVLLEWAYAYFTYQRGARLIVRYNPPSAP